MVAPVSNKQTFINSVGAFRAELKKSVDNLARHPSLFAISNVKKIIIAVSDPRNKDNYLDKIDRIIADVNKAKDCRPYIPVYHELKKDILTMLSKIHDQEIKNKHFTAFFTGSTKPKNAAFVTLLEEMSRKLSDPKYDLAVVEPKINPISGSRP